jgi:ribosomal protein L11 methyltransferase
VIRLAVRVQREHAELVLAELLELAPSGVEESALGDDVVEYAVYGAPGELPALPDLTAAAGVALVEITTTEIADDWADRWREFHQPAVFADRLTVRPSWAPRGDTELDLIIDPGQAFGTGAHATTRLCLQLLLSLPHPSGGLVDLGCGSGVLAITAAKLGFSPVLALDIDPAATAATRANADVNEVELDVRHLDLRSESPPAAPTVAANLLRPLLLAYAAGLATPPERLIAGGLLVGEADEVAQAFSDRGLRERERRTGGEWVALLLEGAVPPPGRHARHALGRAR